MLRLRRVAYICLIVLRRSKRPSCRCCCSCGRLSYSLCLTFLLGGLLRLRLHLQPNITSNRSSACRSALRHCLLASNGQHCPAGL